MVSQNLVMSEDYCRLFVGKDELHYVEDEFYEFESLSILKSIGKIPEKTLDNWRRSTDTIKNLTGDL